MGEECVCVCVCVSCRDFWPEYGECGQGVQFNLTSNVCVDEFLFNKCEKRWLVVNLVECYNDSWGGQYW